MAEFVEDFSDPVVWDSFVSRSAGPDGGLLQSWAWGEVQRTAGRRVHRCALVERANILAGWQVVSHRLPLGQAYWYVPRPVERIASSLQPAGFIRQLIAFIKKEKAVFIRIDGAQDASLQSFGFRLVEGAVQPQEELIIDVQRSAADLISAMKQKTRYNIRIAEKRGVAVAAIPLAEPGFATFWPLLTATAVRQNIRPHAASYYRAIFTGLGAARIGRLLVAQAQGVPVAVALLAHHNRVLTYLHGGSADDGGELMAPHLLHWQAIKLAQQLGCRAYNFGGVSSANPAWAGLTRFKHGFAPATAFTNYGGLWERPVKAGRYWLYRVVRTIS